MAISFYDWFVIREGTPQYPPELDGVDFTDYEGRNKSLQQHLAANPDDYEGAYYGKTPFDIRLQEVTKAWKHIVSTFFPGGSFSDKSNVDWLKPNGDVMQYNTQIDNRKVDFSLQRDRYGKEMWATVDFGWDQPPEGSLKDKKILNGGDEEGEVAGGAANMAAKSLQPGTINFMRTLQQKYIIPLHKYGIKVKFNSADEGEESRRTPLYNRALKQAGYEPVSVYGKKNTFKPSYAQH